MSDIHLVLDPETLERIDTLAHKLGSDRTALTRQAVREYLDRKEQDLRSEELARYARERAPWAAEFLDRAWSEVSQEILEPSVRERTLSLQEALELGSLQSPPPLL